MLRHHLTQVNLDSLLVPLSATPRIKDTTNPVEGNGLHTRLKGLSHRVVGRAVNCPLSGPPGLRSSLGGEAASIFARERADQLYCVCTQYS